MVEGVTISVTQWQRATEALQERRKEQPKKRWIRHFKYDLQAGKISSWNAKEASALFFEYEICSGVDINNNYILLEISDGADDADGVKLYQSFKYQNDPQRELILRTGVTIVGEDCNLFSLIGASNSGVQTHSYVFRRGSLAQNERLMLELMPNLRRLELSKGVAKRIKYQGLLFSGAQVVDLPQDDGPVHVLEIPSVERKRPYSDATYDFTDGCGLISIKLAKFLHKKILGLGMSKGHSSGVPSVFHIRYAGQIRKLTGIAGGNICKGVFLVDYRNDSTYEMGFRKSMLKETVSTKCASVLGRKIGIIGWSKESPGRLSQQLICLLTASVPPHVLQDMQNQQLKAVEEAVTDPMSAAWLAALEPKPGTWYAFQGLLLGAAREHQSGTPDTSVQKDAPSSYFACTNGRSHPRHLSDNLTKVQVPLSSARTLFGVAFPETLSKVIKEGECIVMLEDGPLEDKVVIVSRSPSYHPGDVRVLHNRASELPDNHPVAKLTNCIIFGTDGNRPDADKMGGGDLDGDRFLIVWDYRLIKYSNKIQAYEAQDYDVDSSGNERKRAMVVYSDDQTKNSDWIHAAAMLDSVMLGAIENSYYALAKEFGVISAEINELNQLFSQLIDRKPAALESFETLCKKAYNPQHAKKSLIGQINNSKSEHDALWEVMLLRQKELLAKMRCISGASQDDYIIFHANLQKLCDVNYLEHRLSDIQFHFGASFHKKRISRTLEQFRELAIASKEPTTVSSPFATVMNSNDVYVTYSQFVNKMDTILLEANAEMSKTLELIRSQQQRRLETIQRQEQLHASIVRRFESGEIESVDGEVEACRKICDELYIKVDDAKHQVSNYKKSLVEKKVAKEKCSSKLYELKARSSELPVIIEKNEATIKSLRTFKKEVNQYASDIGVPKFSYSGSFLGMEKHELLSSASSLSINICVVEFNASLDKAKECLTESLEVIQSIPLISMITEEHQHIQKLQHNYLSANSIHLVVQTYLPVIKLLQDLSMSKEHHGIVGDLDEKCQAVIKLTKSALTKSTSSFKNCLLYSDVIYLAECARQSDLNAIADIIEKELVEITKVESDLSRFRDYYQWFRKFIVAIPLKEKRALLETRKAKNDLQRIESLSMEQSKLENDIKELEELKISAERDIDDMTRILDKTYSPSIFEQTVKDYAQENSYEDSIELSIGHIRHEYNKYISKWGNQNGLNIGLLDSIEDGMKRICSIEVNRCNKFGEPLPVYKKRAELNRLIAANDVVIVTAQTGSGKSTQVPQYLADDQYTWISGSNNAGNDEAKNRGFRLCCTQPRRIAARSIAERVAKEYQTRLGMKVGFRVGRRDGVELTDSKKISDCTEIEYVTEGLLLAQLRGSPNRIKNYDVVIIDEAHERNIETDLLLSFLRNHLRRLKTNPQPGDIPLKVIVMSASIDFERFCEYFDGCPRMDCPGKIYDVEEHYRPVIEEDAYLDDDYSMSYDSDQSCDDEFVRPNSFSKAFTSIADEEKTLVEHATSVLFEDIVCPENDQGDVLIFFSGSREIWECVDAINARARSEGHSIVSYPLYSSMDEESKNASKDPSHRVGLDSETQVQPQGYVRKVICCTNIAETSLTIDGVRFVIDTGKAKKMRYSHLLRTMTLREEDVAQSSTKQRKGRAGRTQKGWVYYLFSKQAHDQMEEYELPKILQTPVEQLILYSMYNCECSIEKLGLLDSPSPSNIDMAKGRLEDLGFVTYVDDERTVLRLTIDGQLSAILSSLQPEAVRMILWANTNAPMHRKRVIKMAALLSIEDEIFIGPSKLRTEPMSTKGFTKTRSRTSIQLVRDEAEVYAYEEDQKQHQLGDHFLLLREFECFENERMKCLKAETNSKLRLWCKKRGLNYAALNQAQLLAERCHNELKKRKVLVDQSEVLQNAGYDETNKVCRWTSDEVIIRAMLTGYFHQIVQSSDPLLKRKQSDFTILSPHEDLRFNVRLDRDSCLWRIAKSTQKTETVLDYIPDDDNEEMQTTDIVIEKQVQFSLLLFTRLQTIVVRSNQHELVFMQGATAVDVNWLSEQAPGSWLERVNVDELKSNMICGLIRNIGPRVLVGLLPFLKELKTTTTAKDININKDTGEIIVYGSQAVVLSAKSVIMTKVDSIMDGFYAKDVKSVSTSIGNFGSGLELQILSENKSSDQYKGWLLKEIPKRLLSLNCREPLSIKVPNPVGDQIEVYIKNTWDVKLFSIMFNEISNSFNADNRSKCSVSIISPTRGVKFFFKFVVNGVDLTIQNAIKGNNGRKAKRKRKRGDKVRTNNSNGGDQIQLDGYIQDIKMRIWKAVQNEMNLLSVGSFPTEKLPLVRSLIREFQMQTQFWTSHFPMVKFSPSHGHFEMFQLTPQELQARIATLATRRTVIQLDAAARPKKVEESCEKVSDDEVKSELHEVEHFTRSELCRFSAIIEGFRKSHPNVLWVVNYTIDGTVNEEEMGKQADGEQSSSELLSGVNDEQDEMVLDQSENSANSMTEKLINKDQQDDNESSHDNENTTTDESPASNESIAKAEVGTIGLLAPSYWLKSDYERLLAVHENRFQDGAVTGLSIAIHSFSKTQPMKAISDCRQQLKSFFLDTTQLILPDVVESGTRQKVCVMCRRVVEIRFRGTSGGSKLQGHQLTICGCAYCRECFRASAEQSANNSEAVQCRNCKRQVLARDDCQQILGTNYKYKHDPLFHVHQNEWMWLLRKAEKKYCAEILVGGGEYSNIHTCTDCGAHSVFNTSKPFFRCSEINCPNVFCNTCHNVASSLSAEQQKVCADRKCKKHEES